MATLTLTRTFKASPKTVYDFVTQSKHLVTWWGPETMTLPDCHLDFTRKGPWHSVMQNAEGQTYKCSGHVTHLDPPHSVGFTWAWHDENDTRGVESHVTIRLVPAQNGGTEFTLTHIDLPDEETARNHEGGWASCLHKLERMANA